MCLSQGFQSYSDLVRTAVQELLSNRGGRGPAPAQSAVEVLTRRIESLDRDLKELIGTLELHRQETAEPSGRGGLPFMA